MKRSRTGTRSQKNTKGRSKGGRGTKGDEDEEKEAGRD